MKHTVPAAFRRRFDGQSCRGFDHVWSVVGLSRTVVETFPFEQRRAEAQALRQKCQGTALAESLKLCEIEACGSLGCPLCREVGDGVTMAYASILSDEDQICEARFIFALSPMRPINEALRIAPAKIVTQFEEQLDATGFRGSFLFGRVNPLIRLNNPDTMDVDVATTIRALVFPKDDRELVPLPMTFVLNVGEVIVSQEKLLNRRARWRACRKLAGNFRWPCAADIEGDLTHYGLARSRKHRRIAAAVGNEAVLALDSWYGRYRYTDALLRTSREILDRVISKPPTGAGRLIQ